MKSSPVSSHILATAVDVLFYVVLAAFAWAAPAWLGMGSSLH